MPCCIDHVGVDVPLGGFFRALNVRVDRAIGADQLNAGMRSQLLFEQVQAIAQMTPVTALGTLPIAALVLWVGHDAPAFSWLLAWSAAITLTAALSLLRWMKAKGEAQRRSPGSTAIRNAILGSAVMGLLWG